MVGRKGEITQNHNECYQKTKPSKYSCDGQGESDESYRLYHRSLTLITKGRKILRVTNCNGGEEGENYYNNNEYSDSKFRFNEGNMVEEGK